MKIFLIGYRCTGKSTIGKKLANLLNYDSLDLDKKIESEQSCTIASIVDVSGWDKFRQLEKKALFKTKGKQNIVVSTGGGIILDIENRKFLKHQDMVVWLFADSDIIIKRLKNDNNNSKSRPSLTDKDLRTETQILIKEREPYYSDVSDMKIDSSFKTPEELAHFIKRRISNDRE
jgi:shikimate kinase